MQLPEKNSDVVEPPDEQHLTACIKKIRPTIARMSAIRRAALLNFAFLMVSAAIGYLRAILDCSLLNLE